MHNMNLEHTQKQIKVLSELHVSMGEKIKQLSTYLLNKSMKTKIKDCPFCGKEAYVNWYTDDQHYTIGCGIHRLDDSFDSESEALEEWNRRGE